MEFLTFISNAEANMANMVNNSFYDFFCQGQLPEQKSVGRGYILDQQVPLMVDWPNTWWLVNGNDKKKLLDHIKQLAKWLGVTDRERREGETDFVYVLRILEDANNRCESLVIGALKAAPKALNEPLARETKVKFDNRCAGSRWNR